MKVRPRVTMKLAAGAGALAIASILGLAACGGGDDNDGGSNGANEDVSVTLGVIFTGQNFAVDLKGGADQAADDLGPMSVKIIGPPSLDPQAAQQQVSSALAESPDGIGVSPFPAEVWTRTMQTVHQRESNSLAWFVDPITSPDQAANPPIPTYVGGNEAAATREVIKEAVQRAGLGPDTAGTALIGQCVPGDTGTLAERTRGFKAGLDEVLPNVTQKVFPSGDEPAPNTSAWNSQLKATQDTVIAMGTCNQDADSLATIKGQGGDFVAAAAEIDPKVTEAIKAGDISAAMQISNYLQGYVATQVLADAARGVADLPEGWIDIPPLVITKDNVDEWAATYAGPSQLKAFWMPRVAAYVKDLASHVRPLAESLALD